MSVKIFIVMAPPLTELADNGREWEADNMVFVKDGFSFPALIIPELWLIWQRMWIPYLGYLGYRIIVSLIALALGNVASSLTLFVMAFLFALEANNLRRWSLGRKGWRIVGEAVGRNRNEAEFQFFRDWANRPAATRKPDGDGDGVNLQPGHAKPAPEQADDEPRIFGLFPDPEPRH